jgi:hypothetical protein
MSMTEEQLEYVKKMYDLYTSRNATIPDENLRKLFKKITRDKKRVENNMKLLNIDPTAYTDEIERKNKIKEEFKNISRSKLEERKKQKERLEEYKAVRKQKDLEVKKDTRTETISKYLEGFSEKLVDVVNNISVFQREDYVIATITYTTTSRKTLKEEFPDVELANEWISETLTDISSEVE